ncbi:sporulation and cell division protein SsgA [Pseudonocardia sediminis]|uniref:Sporulation and cell division protein SsgA n=1 Tax=Pseudonocardia sediminis TaxID=1397368 RepID=A0A4Q7U7Q1_PSEST|nr:SsgA family sporulation/cell division regulator [Pseudonocardia sediminis]RZT75517.1 sporulation and cell division protein SsgA [Pseudonocardia sediminis]
MSTATDGRDVHAELAMEALLPCAGSEPRTHHCPITIRLTWSPNDPLLATASIPTNTDRTVEWSLSIDLLTAGLDHPAGLGDVCVLPDPADPTRAELVLSSDTGRICLGFAVENLIDFLARIDSTATPPVVSPSREEVDAMCAEGCYKVMRNGVWVCIRCKQ